jgi:23S rRNA pseudouridine2605 synthase
VRLAKYLAHCGVASRRACESLVAAGRVTVGGRRVTDPAHDVDESSEVAVDGRAVAPEPREMWAVHKPIGVTSTAREPGPRTAVVELVDSDARLYPVGRLDVDSSGLILLTNDGELANRLTHPRYGVPRSYRVRLRRRASDTDLRRLRQGVELEDGPTAPARVRRLGPRELEITIREGRNRQVRRMAEAVGNQVVELTRTGFGTVRLGRLREGGARRLREDELKRLWKDAEHDRTRK